MPILVTQLADGLDPADLDAFEVLRDQHFLLAQLLAGLVVPHLDLDAAVERPARGGRVRRDGLRFSRPFERYRLRRQRQGCLEELRDFACPLARQALVVAVDACKGVRQRLGVGVADEVQAHVAPPAHRLEDLLELAHVARRDVGDPGLEADRRHQTGELDGLEFLAGDFPGLETVPERLLEGVGVVRPLPEGLVVGQVPLNRLADRHVPDVVGAHGGRRKRRAGKQQQNSPDHGDPLSEASRTTAGPGGAPRRQNTSFSIVSS